MAVTRISDSSFSPVRPIKRTSDKIIFISCEGAVTEWEYFEKIINLVFVNISSKVKVINILEDSLKKKDKFRTEEEKRLVSSCAPQNLLEIMNAFKQYHQDEYDFGAHPQDEFWLVMDIDEHTNSQQLDDNGISNRDKWEEVLRQCLANHYCYAVSNPFFELWLLLHFDDVQETDYNYAVTDSHPYEPTNHFRKRLSALKIPLKKDKHIQPKHYGKYNMGAIAQAISRAEALDTDSKCDYPVKLGTTVYRLLKSIAEINSQYEQGESQNG